jgi:MFS family permease
MAPILIKAFGTTTVFYTAAVMLLLAMTRIMQVSASGDIPKPKWIKPKGNLRSVLRWLQGNRSIATMVAVSAIAGVGYTIVSTLAPNYVSEVLDTDPANTVHVMGVAGVGMTISLFIVPPMIARFGERVTAGIGFVLLAVGLVGLGLINSGAIDFLNYINPFHWLDEWINLTDIGINDKIELAMFVSFPVGFGVGLTDNSVKTYLNRRVPVVNQGRTFAIRNLTESALTVIPLLTVSAIATAVGVSAVLAITPIVLYGIAVTLLRISRNMDEEPPDTPHGGVLKTYWEEPDTDEVTPLEEDDDVAPQASPA